MEFTGKVTFVSGVESGISKAGKEWQKQIIVIEEANQQYPQSVAVTLLDDKLINTVMIGDIITASLSFRESEYNGKHFNNISAWRIKHESQQPAQEPVQQPAVPQAAPRMFNDQGNDDLPF